MKNFSLQSYKMPHERKIKPDMSDKTRIKETEHGGKLQTLKQFQYKFGEVLEFYFYLFIHIYIYCICYQLNS